VRELRRRPDLRQPVHVRPPRRWGRRHARIIYTTLASAGTSNYSGYSNPRVDLILANSRKATSLVALRTLYEEAERIVPSDRPVIFLDHPRTNTASSSAVTGLELNSDVQLLGAFAQYR
jgi:ABC-type transport system substrate-binding protein